jgi:hypothetical protein
VLQILHKLNLTARQSQKIFCTKSQFVHSEDMSRNSKPTGETVSFGVRLSTTDREWLERTAAASGVEVSQLVRWAIEALRQYVDAHGGKLHLPIDIQTFWVAAQQVKPTADQPAPTPPAKRKEA